jgi:hypothetical protein
MQIGIYLVLDIAFTPDEQFVLMAYETGLVNLYFVGDNSFSFITTI